MRADADADAGAETPLESHLPKRPKRCDMIRHDITRAYSRFTNTQRTSAFSRSADFRFLAHEPSLDLGHSRFKDKPDCVVLPADRICALALLLYLHRRLQSGVVSCEAPPDGLQCAGKPGRPGGHVRVGCGRSGGSCWAALLVCEYATMHIHACRPVGWATGAWRGLSDGRRSSSISISCR